jgi:hypothetical protein
MCYKNELILGYMLYKRRFSYVLRERVDLGYMPRKRDDSYMLNTKN